MATMTTVEELLEKPLLAPYLPHFHSVGYDDLEFMLEMDNDELDTMLDEVSAEAVTAGLPPMKPGVKMRIKSTLRREKRRRADAADNERAAQTAAYGGHAMGGQLTRVPSQPLASQTAAESRMSAIRRPSSITETYVMMDGLSCLRVHWAFCFGLCVLCILCSVFLFELSKSLSDNDGGNDDERQGGWDFVFAVTIFGWVMSGVFFCLCICSYQRHPDALKCSTPRWCQDDLTAACSICAAFAALADCFCSIFKVDCSCCEDICEGLCEDLECPSCGCSMPRCDTGECSMPSCDCDNFCPDLACADLMPDLQCRDLVPSVDCCPDCGDARECCYTAYKIVCCKCQIQV